MIVASKSVRELVEVEFGTLTDPRPRWDSDASLIAPPIESVTICDDCVCAVITSAVGECVSTSSV